MTNEINNIKNIKNSTFIDKLGAFFTHTYYFLIIIPSKTLKHIVEKILNTILVDFKSIHSV